MIALRDGEQPASTWGPTPVTALSTAEPGAPHLVLSLFPGIDILGMGFEETGFSVVRGPDTLWGQSMLSFHAPAGHFDGVIAGPPCQDFSRARRTPPTGNGLAALRELKRVILETQPHWYLVENVPAVPDVRLDGYTLQRMTITAAECGLHQRRSRVIQFGSRDGGQLVILRTFLPTAASQPTAMASEGTRPKRRSWPEFCALQGLDEPPDLTHFSTALRYRLVGNAVPLPMARMLATAVLHRHDNEHERTCVCGCGRPVPESADHAGPTCRKRMQRRRDRSMIASAGTDTIPSAA